MKWNNKSSNDEDRWNYQIFNLGTNETAQKTSDLEQHFIVPWELTDDDSKKWSLEH